jgi:hypothetical protein
MFYKECCICYDKINTLNKFNNRYKYCSKCVHITCENCSKKWSTNCPMCRSKTYNTFLFKNIDLFIFIFYTLYYLRFSCVKNLYTNSHNIFCNDLLTYMINVNVNFILLIFDMIFYIYNFISFLCINFYLIAFFLKNMRNHCAQSITQSMCAINTNI